MIGEKKENKGERLISVVSFLFDNIRKSFGEHREKEKGVCVGAGGENLRSKKLSISDKDYMHEI